MLDMHWIRYDSADTRDEVFPVATGRYQQALLEGSESWSGSTLAGAQKRYSSNYKRSRESLAEKIRDAGFHLRFETVSRRRVAIVEASPLGRDVDMHTGGAA